MSFFRALCRSLPLSLPLASVSAADAVPAVIPGAQSVLSTILGLGLILALIYGASWVLKRMGHLPSANKGLVRIVGGASLGARERIVVVDVEDARLVLGVSPGRVQTLHVMPATDTFERSLDEAKEAGR